MAAAVDTVLLLATLRVALLVAVVGVALLVAAGRIALLLIDIVFDIALLVPLISDVSYSNVQFQTDDSSVCALLLVSAMGFVLICSFIDLFNVLDEWHLYRVLFL